MCESYFTGGEPFMNIGALGRPESDGTPRVWYALVTVDPTSPWISCLSTTISRRWRARWR